MPCTPTATVTPTGSSAPAIHGFGIPFSIQLPNFNPFPAGFPEDLLDILNEIQLLVPPGPLMPQLNANFGKDIFDGIMKLLDQFMPFLMLYKFFLPILEIIICIIEVLCALMNPFKLIPAINRLLTQCIPAFLNMFPPFAFIIMIISLLLLILALVEYIINKIIAMIEYLLKNILGLEQAFQYGDANGVLAIVAKLGAQLCVFQNLFVLLSIFDTIIQIIKDILNLIFHIPPCSDGGSGDQNSCCTPDVCPEIVKTEYTNMTGTLKYFPLVEVETTIPLPTGPFNVAIRNEQWQLYDNQQTQGQAFSNIYNAFDVTGVTPQPVFFPTDAVYNAQTAPAQAPYQIDLRLYYDPIAWGRTSGTARYIRFKNCIMTNVPSTNLIEADNSIQTVNNAVANIVGGLGYEDDGITQLQAFVGTGQATLENFLTMPAMSSASPVLKISDGYTFIDATYTFRPNIAPLLQKNLITLGCIPDVALNREFVNNVLAGDVGLKTQQLQTLLKSPNSISPTRPSNIPPNQPFSLPAGTQTFPSTAAAQTALTAAVNTLRNDMNPTGVTNFQNTSNVILNSLKADTNSALAAMVGIGFAPCSSSVVTSPSTQFTSTPITVTVVLNEQNNLPLTAGLSAEVGANIAARISSYITFGTISNFVYDGYKSFVATLTGTDPGSGQLMIAFDNNFFCTNTLPAPANTGASLPPTHTLQTLDYQFIYAPSISIPGTIGEDGGIGTPGSSGSSGPPGTSSGVGDTGGTQPRRDPGDTSRDGGKGQGGS
jgi:hypothetical protein